LLTDHCALSVTVGPLMSNALNDCVSPTTMLTSAGEIKSV
jgi:hypothetical protein